MLFCLYCIIFHALHIKMHKNTWNRNVLFFSSSGGESIANYRFTTTANAMPKSENQNPSRIAKRCTLITKQNHRHRRTIFYVACVALVLSPYLISLPLNNFTRLVITFTNACVWYYFSDKCDDYYDNDCGTKQHFTSKNTNASKKIIEWKWWNYELF